MTVNSSGSVGYDKWITPDVTKVVINNASNKMSYFNIGVIMDKANLKEVILPDNIVTLHGSTSELSTSGFTQFVLPESVTSIINSAGGLKTTKTMTTYCTQTQINNGLCGDSAYRYERDENNNLVVYNKDGTIKGVYSDYAGITHDTVVDSYEKTNDQNGRTDKFDGRGKLTGFYTLNSDDSISIYDANGKLTGLKNAREITPAQAAELVKPGKNNTVTLTFK